LPVTNDELEAAFQSTRTVLSRVKEQQLGLATPCRSWNVGQLVSHMVAAPRVGVAALRGGEWSDDGTDYSKGDFLAAYDETTEQTVVAFSEPGALERTVRLPFTEVPGAFLRMMITTDQFTHGWDLARATAQPTDLQPELAEELLSQVAIPDEFRGEDGVAPFGPERPARAGAGAADRLAALLGRAI
jgi:uncharacterized protein (TIGR03086 family)